MPTFKQKRIAKLIIENATLDKPLNGGQMLAKVGYAKSMHRAKVNDVLESEGVKEELAKSGFTEYNAKKVVSEIMLNEKEKSDTRLKATDQIFKVHGSYKNEGEKGNKTLIINITGETAQRYGITSNTETSSS